MGYIKHEVVIVTGWDAATVAEAHAKATALCGDMVTPITEARINGYRSFFIAPDGSKEGWAESDTADEQRKAFRAWLRAHDDRLGLRWVCVVYGDDAPRITVTSYGDDDASAYEQVSDEVDDIPHGRATLVMVKLTKERDALADRLATTTAQLARVTAKAQQLLHASAHAIGFPGYDDMRKALDAALATDPPRALAEVRALVEAAEACPKEHERHCVFPFTAKCECAVATLTNALAATAWASPAGEGE